MTCCVYWIHLSSHSDLTKDGYIGISTDFVSRLRDHKSKSTKAGSHLYRAIRHYGWDNIIVDKLVVSSLEYCRDLEYKLRPLPSIGWNEIPGGDLPPSLNPLIASKISLALKGKPGIKHTEETKQLISQSNRTRQLTPESKKRVADAMRETQRKRIEMLPKQRYLITYPCGRTEVIDNLSLWCELNGILQSSMNRVARGDRVQHKNYKCKKVTNSC